MIKLYKHSRVKKKKSRIKSKLILIIYNRTELYLSKSPFMIIIIFLKNAQQFNFFLYKPIQKIPYGWYVSSSISDPIPEIWEFKDSA